MKVTLSLTHRCNLSCSYCYSGRKFNKDMSYNTARKIVDFAIDITPDGERIEFCFFGGEPLLCFDMMKKIVTYIRQRERESSKPVWLSVTSNGTLLTNAVLSYFKSKNIDLCVSIDGPEHIHNKNRHYLDGRGSFSDTVKNLQNAIRQLNYLQVNVVYGPDTINFLPETVSFLTGLGISTIHLNPNICASWEIISYSKLREAYEELGSHYIEKYQSGQELALNMIDNKIILFLKGGYGTADRCGMGETEWGFAPSGNIYPCERFIGEDTNSALCLGNIYTGLDSARRCSLLKRRGNRKDECKTCALQQYCMNTCAGARTTT